MATQKRNGDTPNGRRVRAGLRTFTPKRPVIVVTAAGVATVPPANISPLTVGWKAFGLTCLPEEWVPPFFVVDATAVAPASRALKKRIATVLAGLDLDGSTILVRSSGATETIEERGKLLSEACPSDRVVETIQTLTAQLRARTAPIHWVIQRYIPAARQGHLSNERRLSYEPRDFVAEVQVEADRPGTRTTIAVRHWRDGAETPPAPLNCTTETGVTLTLKSVALWATALPSRMLFEWVWSGTRLWVVQADVAKPPAGVDPKSILPTKLPILSLDQLTTFRIATDSDYAQYGKLKNARTYRKLGYDMPLFYVLNEVAIIHQILTGTVPASVSNDLVELTRRPLIIRTDGLAVPSDKRQMLPRSDELRSAEAAIDWLRGKFATEIAALGLTEAGICLIAHHFIPSAAAAWSRAEPGKDIVRIESLWGLPEGLYWYSHDTFEVDVRGKRPVRQRPRYKGTFVGPDESGRWINFRTADTHDWKKSIARGSWLEEIAKTTRAIADHDGRAVAVMWFIDNHRHATTHKVLPWFHLESSLGAPKAAPRQKLATSSDFKITTSNDWQELQTVVEGGRGVERVDLEPHDPELLRNQGFAKALGAFCARHHIVIELAGAILSHAYHLLRDAGAQVECIDLFGADEENVDYNKLVRDKIPGSIRGKGEGVEVLRLKGDALISELRRKLVEESYEAMDATSGVDLIAELADVQEVIRGICDVLQVPLTDVEAERQQKRERTGGFESGFMLQATTSPHSLVSAPNQSSMEPLLDPIEPAVIGDPAAIPEAKRYRKPDLRNVDQQAEGLLTIEIDLNRRIRDERHPVAFEFPVAVGDVRLFTVTVELTRVRSSLRAKVRARLEPSQLALVLLPGTKHAP
jgi:predicted house-cleaning noncanonical NTP pyrophosphatase (MazG superfamily)